MMQCTCDNRVEGKIIRRGGGFESNVLSCSNCSGFYRQDEQCNDNCCYHGPEFSQDMPPDAWCCHCGTAVHTYSFRTTVSPTCGEKL